MDKSNLQLVNMGGGVLSNITTFFYHASITR